MDVRNGPLGPVTTCDLGIGTTPQTCDVGIGTPAESCDLQLDPGSPDDGTEPEPEAPAWKFVLILTGIAVGFATLFSI